MNFTTKISPEKSKNPIDYTSKIMSLGSCFAQNMGEKFHYFKFQIMTNPFGIIFNPISIEKLIERVVNQVEFTENDIFFHNERWHCSEIHSELSHPDKEEFLAKLNSLIELTNQQIRKSTHFIITYGTAYVYRYKSSDTIVANCHKVSQNQFGKEILGIDTIEKSIQNTVALIHKVNPKCTFIFTVSPVRHIKDGFMENQRSKAHLIAAIHNSQFIIHNYFPSYEIMMDELRDYRFYADDMLHPSKIAINYIWECFFTNYIAEECVATMQEIDAIQKAMAHKPFNPNSSIYNKFLDNLETKIMNIQKTHPTIEF